MASAPVVFLLFTLLSVAIRAQQNQSNLIKPGSSLFPTIHPRSWLSPSRLFEFGFYQQGNGFAVGIWLVGHPKNTVVWTAYRDDPPVSSNATLEFTKDGELLLRTEEGEGKPLYELLESATSASMLDTGNFVLYSSESLAIWESFNDPTDTILGGQNLSMGSQLVSSLSPYNHSSGRFVLAMQIDGNLVAYPINSAKLAEDSYWSTQTVGTMKLSLDPRGSLGIIMLSRDIRGVPYNYNRRGFPFYYNRRDYPIANVSSSDKEKIIYRATLDADGVFRLYSHSFEIANVSTMSTEWSSLQNQCDVKGFCGFNSFCSDIRTKAKCFCFPGFVFINPEIEFLGCYRSFIDEVDCRMKELGSFYSITNSGSMKLGGVPYSGMSMNEEDCGKSCQEDCNCEIAMYSDETCSKYKLPLTYGRLDKNESAVALVKVSLGISHVANYHNPLIPMEPSAIIDEKKKLILILAISFGFITFLCSLVAISSLFIYRRRVHVYKKLSENSNLGLTEEFAMRPFSYRELENATDGFKEELGRGSFGAVYKGAISEGNKVIAVKRLEKVLDEGRREFQTEITIIGRTHHRNLVRLLGFCIEGSRKLLVYEYMKNGSLADLLFKVERRPIWKERVRIALDIARGILYLHEECESHIIHCDIKPQNILMDDSWTAKISDFGLARLLMPNQRGGTITEIRGTRGYLAPEWQKNTSISAKADVFSFGIVLLEIVCCRSNMEVNVSTADESLLSTWVYKCFVAKEMDKLVGDEEVVEMKTLERMVKVGLLCIQDDPSLRPLMKNVILMLEGTVDIPIPLSPSHFIVID